MRVLAIDIGGTNSRFTDVLIKGKATFSIEKIFTIDTAQSSINSFQDFIDTYNRTKPDTFSKFHDYATIAIAVAGPVDKQKCSPPNIRWNIDLNEIPSLPKTFLLNDFAAQAYAFIKPQEQTKLVLIRQCNEASYGNSAVIGAGTGLGHCLITTIDNEHHHVIASEAGQTGFTFNQSEDDIKTFFHYKTKSDYILNDMVVSGSGLSILHEYVTGDQISTQEILNDYDKNRESLNCFSRFYARACRNYCLTNVVTNKLIISGGLAIKHPMLVNNDVFIEEFEKQKSHSHLFKNISIYLNQNENIGLDGAIYYSLIK